MSVEVTQGPAPAIRAGVREAYTGILLIRPLGPDLAVDVTGPKGGRTSGSWQARLTTSDARALATALITLADDLER